ncbi:WD40 domain containing protein [Pyrrhoderma noxium]|uniref:WD40 domain containing protein n=1 Tax=Pyrrhoderma noxium TaxID=2282107 RepID=A0A286USQ6_9AGAM|nr:WD40 domain containing protein [Pyrrhoderma noxium]
MPPKRTPNLSEKNTHSNTHPDPNIDAGLVWDHFRDDVANTSPKLFSNAKNNPVPNHFLSNLAYHTSKPSLSTNTNRVPSFPLEAITYTDIDARHCIMMSRLKESLKPCDLPVDQHGCLKGTRLETLQKIYKWIEDPRDSNVCLLLGAAGTGKSAIVTTLAKGYRACDSLGCHLVFRKGKSKPRTVLRSIAYSLAMHIPKIAEAIYFCQRSNLGSASQEAKFSTLLKDPLNGISGRLKSPILVILDGIDECGTPESREPLMRVLRDGLPDLPHVFRFLITARPEKDISFLTYMPGFHRIILERHSEENKLDISTYIKYSFERIKWENHWMIPDDFSWDESIQTLTDAADGLFIWAAAAVSTVEMEKFAQFRRFKTIVRDVKSLQLDDFYATILEDVLHWDEKIKNLFRRVFFLIFSYNTPISNQDISSLLGVEIRHVSRLLSRFRSLAMYKEGKPIRIYHSSFYDYITSCAGRPWYIDIEAQKVDLSEIKPQMKHPDLIKQRLQGRLSKLQHLDVLGHVKVDPGAVMRAHGGSCDILTGVINREYLDATIAIEQSGRKVKVAVKRLRVNLGDEIISEDGENSKDEDSFFKAFVKELTVWSKLKHQNVLPLLGYYVDGNYPYIVSEWMENGTARRYVQQYNLPVEELLPILLGIANGLKYIHDNKVIHSDLKAENILISASKVPLICDFGISRTLNSSITLRTTTSAFVRGTQRFMAPELLQGDGQHTMATDIWALGMTYYEIISKKIPFFQHKRDGQVIFSVANKKEVPEFPSSLIDLGGLVDCIWNVLLLCWTYDDEDRLETHEVVEALETCIKTVSETGPEIKELARSDAYDFIKFELYNRRSGISRFVDLSGISLVCGELGVQCLIS